MYRGHEPGRIQASSLFELHSSRIFYIANPVSFNHFSVLPYSTPFELDANSIYSSVKNLSFCVFLCVRVNYDR
jgi:hypothetical protein